MSSTHCIRVPPRSRADLRSVATQLLELCGIRTPYVPVVEILEHHLSRFGVEFEYMSREEMGNDHGRSFPDQGRIQVREDVYCRACDGKGRDRFTIGHEIGHVLLHGGLSLQRTAVSPNSIKTYENSEWQADAFAGELLMPLRWVLARCNGPPDLVETFGVSESAAWTHWKALCKKRVIKGANKMADRGASSIRRTRKW